MTAPLRPPTRVKAHPPATGPAGAPAAAGPVLDLDRYVPALIAFISNKLANGASATYRRRFGINVTEWRVLALLAIEPGIPAQRISQVIGFDKALVSRVVQALAAKGRVRTAPDANDSRRIAIALTASGRALHDAVIAVALERERRLLAGFTAEEVETLIGLLRRMHQRVEIVNAAPDDLPSSEPKRRQQQLVAPTPSPRRRDP